MERILIIGATSAIAEAVARTYAEKKARFYLLGRDAVRLEAVVGDLSVRGAAFVGTALFDANDIGSFQGLLQRAYEALDSAIDIVLIAHGYYWTQDVVEMSVFDVVETLQVNAVSTIALLAILGDMMEKQGHGALAVISSVAGDRGRPSNYVYGSSKATVTSFCEGLRARLYKHGVHVLTIKPGMVDTPMTSGLDLPPMLVAGPGDVAADIVRALERKTDLLYSPWYWRYVMWAIVHMPRKVFKKLNL